MIYTSCNSLSIVKTGFLLFITGDSWISSNNQRKNGSLAERTKFGGVSITKYTFAIRYSPLL